jgi:mono/diheme cytochrome c family protein
MAAHRLLLTPALLGCGATAASAQSQQGFVSVEHRRALAAAGDCVACHTAPGGKPFAGGRPVPTPFGIVVSANITPDPATGIGERTGAQFLAALRRGIGNGGKHLYPAMPYIYFYNISRRDVRDIRAYLATVQPVRNKVRSDQLPFPFSIRFSMVVTLRREPPGCDAARHLK